MARRRHPRPGFRLPALLLLALWIRADAALAQDMLRHVDLNSLQMTEAEMTREQVVAEIARAPPKDLPT